MNKYLLLGIVVAINFPSIPTLALEPSAIYAKAKEFTVQIDGEETGTGTIIENNNGTYTVLTCWHVMDTPGNYEVTTNDGKTHEVTEIQNLPDVDLALVTFSTSNSYPIVELGDSTTATPGLSAYVVGYPDPFPGSPERSYFTDNAEVQSRQTSADKGYQIIHDGSFSPGSSGGGIFDQEARLIAINGQFISEGNTGKTYGVGIPLEIFIATQSNFVTPNNIEAPQDFVSVGKRKLKQKDYQGSIVAFDRALVSNPNDLEAWLWKAGAYIWQGDFPQAISSYDEVLKRDPENTTAYNNRGHSYNELGEYNKAIADLDEAIFLNPTNAIVHNNRGNSYNSLGEYGKAISDFDEAIRLSPQYALAYNNRGISYVNLGEYEQAISNLNEAIRLSPQYPISSYTTRGLSYAELGEYDKAIADFDEAIRLDPQSATAYYNRGLTYKDANNISEAIQDFEQAANFYQQQGNSEWNQRALSEIQELRGLN